MRYLPNIITVFRCLASVTVPLMIIIGTPSLVWLAFILFALAALTDWLDGYLARLYDARSDLGMMLDPVADKLLIAGCLLAVAAMDQHGLPIFIPALAILMREVLVSGLREYVGKEAGLGVTNLAKYKTALQFIAIGLAIIYPLYEDWPYMMSTTLVMFYLAALLTLATGIDYFIRACRHVTK